MVDFTIFTEEELSKIFYELITEEQMMGIPLKVIKTKGLRK